MSTSEVAFSGWPSMWTPLVQRSRRTRGRPLFCGGTANRGEGAPCRQQRRVPTDTSWKLHQLRGHDRWARYAVACDHLAGRAGRFQHSRDHHKWFFRWHGSGHRREPALGQTRSHRARLPPRTRTTCSPGGRARVDVNERALLDSSEVDLVDPQRRRKQGSAIGTGVLSLLACGPPRISFRFSSVFSLFIRLVQKLPVRSLPRFKSGNGALSAPDIANEAPSPPFAPPRAF